MLTKEQPPRRLTILVVGAGIGGLAAALALRRQGHQVTVRYSMSGEALAQINRD